MFQLKRQIKIIRNYKKTIMQGKKNEDQRFTYNDQSKQRNKI